MSKSILSSLTNVFSRFNPSVAVSTMHRSPAAILSRPISSDVDTEVHQPRDPNTLSNYNAWKLKHVTADLELDFKGKRVWGSVKYDMQRIAKGVEKVVLDTRLVFLFLVSKGKVV